MIRKEHLGASMARECDIANHLFTKLGSVPMDYRPSAAQRSTLELLQYLSVCGIVGIRCMADGDWTGFNGSMEQSRRLTAERFPEAMNQQKRDIEAFFDSVTEAQLESQEAPMPGGGTLPLGLAILNGPFKWLTAYKLQLFLYAKANGVTDIGTANAWAGIDWKQS